MKLERNGQQGSACHHGARQEGAILVEFALVLPLLLLLLLGTVEFGRAINKNPGPGSSLQESILSEADTTQLREGAKVCINLPPGSRGKVGEPVEATVSYGFNWMPFIRSQLGVTTTTLSGAATMRLEQAMTISHTEC
jgi:hypothetical protein